MAENKLTKEYQLKYERNPSNEEIESILNIPKDKISNLYKYDRWDIYNAYKNGVPKEEELKKIIAD